MGLGPFPVWRIARCKMNLSGFPLQASCHLEWREPAPALEMETWFTHVEECRWSTLYCFCWFVACCCLHLLDEQLVSSCPMVRLFPLP